MTISIGAAVVAVVVIGGQKIAKTGKGLLTYHLLIVSNEGILAAASVVFAPPHTSAP